MQKGALDRKHQAYTLPENQSLANLGPVAYAVQYE